MEHVWKRDENTLVTRKKFKESLPSPSIPQKEKSWTVDECMLSLPIPSHSLHEVSLSKLLVTNFYLG
jgi:hypothetical protein